MLCTAVPKLHVCLPVQQLLPNFLPMLCTAVPKLHVCLPDFYLIFYQCCAQQYQSLSCVYLFHNLYLLSYPCCAEQYQSLRCAYLFNNLYVLPYLCSAEQYQSLRCAYLFHNLQVPGVTAHHEGSWGLQQFKRGRRQDGDIGVAPAKW